MAGDRLKYHWSETELENEAVWGPQECDSFSWQKCSAVGNSDLSRVITFKFEPDNARFTDTSSTVLHLVCRVLCEDGTPLKAEDEVFLGVDDANGLFSSTQVSLGNSKLPIFELAPYGLKLMNIFGSTTNKRKEIWSSLSGKAFLPDVTTSKVDSILKGSFNSKLQQCKESREMTFYLRFPSPFLQSLAQLLPPSIPLTLTLRRATDAFVLSTLPSSREKKYKLSISYAGCYVKRIRLSDCLMNQIMPSLQQPSWSLKYVRLASVVMQVAQGSQGYRGFQLLSDLSTKLPQRIYIFVISQAAFFGSEDRLSQYHETASIEKLQLSSGGMSLLAEPIKTKFEYFDDGTLNPAECDALQAFLCSMTALGLAFDPQSEPVLNYMKYVHGCFTFVSRLSACHANGQLPGSLAIELSFSRPLSEPCMLCLVGEFPSRITYNPEGGLTVT